MTGKAIFALAMLVGAGICWVLYRPVEECATVSDCNLDLYIWSFCFSAVCAMNLTVFNWSLV